MLTVYSRLVPPPDTPNPGYVSKLYSYHSYVSMYQDQDAGLSGPVIVYEPGKMNSTMASNREFIVFYGDNQESNSFLALHNVEKYLPGVKVANESSTYPEPGPGNHSLWYPQLINTPKTNVTTDIAANFFPVSTKSSVSLQNFDFFSQLPDKRLHLRKQSSLRNVC